MSYTNFLSTNCTKLHIFNAPNCTKLHIFLALNCTKLHIFCYGKFSQPGIPCLIREKVVTFRMVKLNMLLSIFLITK